MASIISIFIWLSISVTIQFLLYPFFLSLISCRRTAYGVSKVFSFTLFSYFVWIVGLITKEDTFLIASLSFVGLLLCTYLYFQKRDSFESVLPDKSEMITIELFYVGILLFTWLQSTFHPEIYWGEKPMDFTFLNYFTRLQSLPPTDPWASGNGLGYYYFGVFQFGLLHKLSGLSPTIGYSFSLAIVAAQFATTFYLILRNFCSQRLSSFFSILICFLATYDTWWVLFTGFKPIGFDLYWATSRTLHTPGINEYPLWSFLFGDLHAHLIALPIVALTVLLLTRTLSSFFENQLTDFNEQIKTCSFMALSWGMLVATNSWDYITVGIVVGCSFVFLLTVFPLHWKNLSILGISTLFLSIIFSLPFHLSVKTKTEIGWGYVYPEEFNTFLEIFRIYGHFLLLILLSVVILWSSRDRYRQRVISYWKIIVGIGAALLPFIIGLIAARARQSYEMPIGPLCFASLISITASSIIFSSFINTARVKVSGILLLISSILLSLAECFYFMDRMNTLFKVYNVIWGIFALGTLILVSHMIIRSAWSRIAVSLILAPAIAATFLLIGIMCSFNRINSPGRPTFDGSFYLKTFNRTEQNAFEWLNKNIKGTPTMVEGFGPSYQEYTRFAMHTGLPVVLGWEYHVQQRGTRDAEQRKKDIRTIYQDGDITQTMRSLNRYNVSIIVIGKRERELYGDRIEEKFKNNPAYFKRIYNIDGASDSISLYTHRYAKSL
jgi:YYY domain-containing protein